MLIKIDLFILTFYYKNHIEHYSFTGTTRVGLRFLAAQQLASAMPEHAEHHESATDLQAKTAFQKEPADTYYDESIN